MLISKPVPKALVVDDVGLTAEKVGAILNASRGFEVRITNDPLEVLEICKKETFELVVMDYQMPKMDGIELLSHLKKSDASTTYVMMTGRNDLKVVINALKAGAQGFVVKPFMRDQLLEAVDLALEKTSLIREHIHIKVYGPMLEGAIGALLSALELEHDDTASHSRRVSYYAKEIAADFEMSSEDFMATRMGALFHDIGKIGIPDDILLKPGSLTPEERVEMMKHPEIGWRIIKDVEGLAKVAEIVRAHHERFDGAGYPDGLKGEDIPLGARIAAVADSFEAMVTARVYSRGKSVDDALLELKRCSGKQFDPDVVEVFLRKIENKEINYIPASTPYHPSNFCFKIPLQDE